MKASLVLFAVFLLLSTTKTDSQDVSALNVANMQTKWITQKLDNFDPKNTQTWQMRYMVDDSVYKSGNPIFVDIGGDATIFAEQPYYDEISTFVEQYNGLLVYTEQRFYGESRPTPDLSVQYLEKYLNIEQALADLANLIRTLKQTYNGAQNSKVILVGGSYGGLMATWFAELYPDLCDGAWASSAPVGLRTNFLEYKEVAGQAVLSVGGQNCYNRIKSAFEYAENMFKQGNGAKLISRLNLCSNFNQSDFMDIANFFSVFSERITTAIQNGGSNTVQDICELFTNSTDDYENFVTNFILTADYVNGSCLDASYQANFNFRSSINWDDNQSGIRQLKFQECHDLGLFQTSDSTAQPFGSTYPLKYFENFCTDLFGAKYTTDYINERIANYNKKFGGLNPNVTNVFFTQGSLDPWRGAGINTYVIQGGTHSEDLFKSTSSDPPELTAAHQKIADLVKGWIGA